MALEYIPCAKNWSAGEQATRNFLMNKLEHTYGVLFGNYYLPRDNDTLECDLVLFNRQGIWVIEVKDWHGPIEIDSADWKRSDGHIELSPLKSIEFKAKNLTSIVRYGEFAEISIIGLVVLASPDAQLINSDGDQLQLREPQEFKVFHLDDRLTRALTGRTLLHKPDSTELNERQIKRLVSILHRQKVDPEKEYIGDQYNIIDDLGPGPNEAFHAYKAKHIVIPEQYARAKQYYLPTAFSSKEVKEAATRFQRDMKALAQMRKHPNIVQVYNYLTDRHNGDMYWLLLEWIDGNTLRYRLELGPDIAFPEQVSILNAVLNALESCHAIGMLHRHLTPSCIFLANDGAVKLGDFDFARVPGFPVTITISGKPLPVQPNRYMAPEMRTDAHSADARSDLYALGAIWYDMIFRPESGERIDLAQLDKTDLPRDARLLLTALLSSDPKDRPGSARAAKRWLEVAQEGQ